MLAAAGAAASRRRSRGTQPDLTGTGDRAHLGDPDTGLADRVADVLAVLELDDLSDVVLVGHSSGGAVVQGVARRCPERLRELVHLDSFGRRHQTSG